MKNRTRESFVVAAIGVAIAAAAIVAALLASGCGPTRPAPAPPPPEPAAIPAPSAKPAPATRLRVASLDVSGFRGRIEQEHVDELSRLVAGRRIEVLAIQGITRYPTLRTRVDLVDGLASAAGMRQAFGETIDLSGRQSGNAVLSAYPVASSDSRAFDGVSGTRFEGALRVIVDAGTRPLIVVSTLLPSPLSAADARICTDVIASMVAERGNDPLLVFGNLPAPPAGGPLGGLRTAEEAGARLWYTPGPIEAGPPGSASCALGTLLISDIDVYPQGSR